MPLVTERIPLLLIIATKLLTYRSLKLFMTPANSLVCVSKERSASLAGTGENTELLRNVDHIDCSMKAAPDSAAAGDSCIRI